MRGVTYKTFPAPVSCVHIAARVALAHMRVEVRCDTKTNSGHEIACQTEDQEIDVQLTSLTPAVTRMRLISNEHPLIRTNIRSADIVTEITDQLKGFWTLPTNGLANENVAERINAR